MLQQLKIHTHTPQLSHIPCVLPIKILSSRALNTYWAVSPEMLLLFMRVINFWVLQIKENADTTFPVLEWSSLRRVEKSLQSIRKCFSSSTSLGQKGQNRAFFSIFRCLPFSIINEWFESLSFVNAVRSSMLRISLRYCSYPREVLKRL